MRLLAVGPAFGLPSIDPECLATIALLRTQVSAQTWTITPTHDQTRRLPCFEDDNAIFSGFSAISKHVCCEETARVYAADSTAISSFLQTRAQILLDLSLYVSYENYVATRTAFTSILPWHANYILPPNKRKDAQKRTQHLGIASLDLDDVHEDLSNRPPGFESVGKKDEGFEAATKQRASFLLNGGRNTVRGLLNQRAEHSDVFKLHALADNFFQPLQNILSENDFFLGTTEPESVDCLVYGYLALMLYPKLPQDWLAKIMRRKYGKLVRFTERIHERLNIATNADEVMALARSDHEEKSRQMTLHWTPPQASGILEIGANILHDLLSRIPIIGPSSVIDLPSESASRSNYLERSTTWHNYFPLLLSLTTTSVGLLSYYAFSTGLLIWPRGEAIQIFGKRRLADYGHLGAALAGVSLLSGQQQQQGARGDGDWSQTDTSVAPIKVEVEVEREGAS